MGGDASQAERHYVPRCPCLPVVLAFGIGIALDHSFYFSRSLYWSMAALALIPIFCGQRAARPVRVVLLLALWVSSGALSHRAAWSDRDEHSVSRFLNDERQLVHVTGLVSTSPQIERRQETGRSAAWLLEDRSRVVVSLTSIVDEESHATAVSGRVQLSVAGDLTDVQIGDRIEVIGWLSKLGGPRNPGGFDSNMYFRAHHVDALMFAGHPDAVKRVSRPAFHLRRMIAEVRNYLSHKFATNLSAENAAIGSAMVLGDRSAIPIALRDAYGETGAMHILAISGLHVGILAALMSYSARLLNIPVTVTAVGIAALIWAYAALTNFSPSVFRATIFVSLWSIATIALRQTTLLNITAVTALALLLFDPLMLFDLGAQLSFLAVLGISWSLQFFPQIQMQSDAAQGYFESRSWIKPVVSIQMLGIGIWLFTAPVTAASFGIVSPIGVLLNVLLIPLTTAVMWAGYLFFASCLVLPFSAGLFAMVFDLGLTAVNFVVIAASRLPYGHTFVSSPPEWWLLGYYPLLAVSLVCPTIVGRRVRLASLLFLWTIAGLGLTQGLSTGRYAGLRMTVLDVGHGGAILIEAPSGGTMLFDCGSMQDDRQGAESVWHCLRERGHSSLDVLVISHADLDHCNNVPALLNGGRIGSVVVHRSFLSFDQRIVKDAVDAASQAGTPIRLINAGDVLRLEQDVQMRVLHPGDRPPGEDDNANSLVIRVEYADRSILLTGDIEGSGFEEMRRLVRGRSHDVVVSPHHGGLLANTYSFANWARPKLVVVSCGDAVNTAAIEELYLKAEVTYFTSRDGAISVEISPEGDVRAEAFLNKQ